MTAQEMYNEIRKELKPVYVNCTYSPDGRTFKKETVTEMYMDRSTMMELSSKIELEKGVRDFLEMSYREDVFNVCDNGENTAKTVFRIRESDINTAMCIQYGKEYANIMMEG